MKFFRHFPFASRQSSGIEKSPFPCQKQVTGGREEGVQQTPKRNSSEVQTSSPKVFFMIGCQRSGSNWLRTMLGGREDLIAPHPPHIMRDFMPILPKYGDLKNISNLKVRFSVRFVSVLGSVSLLSCLLMLTFFLVFLFSC